MKSIQTRMLIIFSFAFIVSSVILSFSIYRSSNELVVNSISTQAKLIAENAVKKVDLNKYEGITPESGPTEYYMELRQQLNDIREMNGLKYLYTMGRRSVAEGYEYFYVVDGFPVESNEASEIGDVEENHYPSLEQTFETKQASIGELSYSEEYGATVTAYVPIINNNGDMIGVLGADFDAENIYQLMKTEKQKMIVLTLIVLIVMFIIIYLLSRYLVQPLKELINHTRIVRTGDFTIKMESNRKDEIGELNRAFNEMIQDINEMIHTVNVSASKLNTSSQEISSTAEQSAKTADVLASTIREITQGSKRQLKIIEDATETIKQMTIGLDSITHHLSEVSIASHMTNDLSNNGIKQIERAVKQINQIKTAQHQSSTVIQELGIKSKEIDEIVDVITNIASQTNLLALNAAIEAARAGEHGRGFAVVSQEVRKLAEQSAQAAKKIAILIKDIQVKTESAVKTMEESSREVEEGTRVVAESGEEFNKIREAVQSVNGQIENVTAAIEQLSAGSSQIVGIIEEVNKIAENSNQKTNDFAKLIDGQISMVHEINYSTDQLKEMSNHLDKVVKQFKIKK
nr:methyl-accepting chemotaxis protein [Bacillus sp. Marseille-P3661]